MAANRSDGHTGMFGRFFSKPSANSKGNAVAYKVGDRTFKRTNGATPQLREVVRMHLQNSGKATK